MLAGCVQRLPGCHAGRQCLQQDPPHCEQPLRHATDPGVSPDYILQLLHQLRHHPGAPMLGLPLGRTFAQMMFWPIKARIPSLCNPDVSYASCVSLSLGSDRRCACWVFLETAVSSHGKRCADLLCMCEQAFAIMPLRLVFPYFGVITDLLQCCGICSELHSCIGHLLYHGCAPEKCSNTQKASACTPELRCPFFSIAMQVQAVMLPLCQGCTITSKPIMLKACCVQIDSTHSTCTWCRAPQRA